MTPDRNKTLTTRQITAAVVTWLDNHGFKPVETEVFVTAGWHADIAGLIECTEGEAVNLRLAPRKPSYKAGVETYRIKRDAFDAAYNALPAPITLLVEVKTSVSDLKRDRKWRQAPPTELCYVAIPPELLTLALSLVPLPWGILTVTERGVRAVRWASIGRTISTEERLPIVYSIAIRRDHRTRHAAIRESQKQSRIVYNQQNVTPRRYSEIANLFLRIANGGGEFLPYGSIEECLNAAHIYLPGYLIKQLEPLWGVLRPRPPETATISGGFDRQPESGVISPR